MSIQGVGIRLDLDAPRPEAPPYSLLKTPGIVVEDSGGRWLNGVNLDTYPDEVPVVWDPCSTGTFRTKDDGSGFDVPQFDPFVIYIPATCSTFSLGRLKEKLAVAFEARQSYGAELGLAAGVPGMATPYLSDANLTLLGPGAVSAARALAYLENAIGLTGQKGVIHATPAVVAMLQAGDKLDGDNNEYLVTPNGTPVVSGGGYIDIKPASLPAPTDGQDYVYATGPVEVRLGPISITDLVSSLDRSDNTVTFRAERPVLATWDPGSLQVAVLVDWDP